MATYAAYRHVELDKVGCGKRSIMKPPGGDCHDIFGADFHGTPSHHRVLKPPGGGNSSLFSISPEDAPKPAPAENLQVMASKDTLNGDSKVNGAKNAALVQRNCVTGEGCQTTDHFAVRVHRQKEGNPVTGEGYDTPTPAPATQVRTRIPPGGYSSGLW